MKRFLILAPHDGAALSPAVYACVTACGSVGGAADLLVIAPGGAESSSVREAAGIAGAAEVVVIRRPLKELFSPELAADMLAFAVREGAYAGAVAAADTFGKDVLPRLAAYFPSAPVTDVVAVQAPDIFRRPVHAGALLQTVRAHGEPLLLTFRASAFARAGRRLEGEAPVRELAYLPPEGLRACEYLGTDASPKGGRPDLSFARAVISGGRGTRGKEGFDLLEALAEVIPDCAVGASRAAVDSGYASNDMQVGQTGKIIAPELYLAVGLSGAAQHLAGMKDSRVIAAVNTDENAPIFEHADVGLVGDLFEVIPQLTELLKARRGD